MKFSNWLIEFNTIFDFGRPYTSLKPCWYTIREGNSKSFNNESNSYKLILELPSTMLCNFQCKKILVVSLVQLFHYNYNNTHWHVAKYMFSEWK